MKYDVKWANSRSCSFQVLCGTKQGGILSPDFFSIYINDLIILLKREGIGCHIMNYFIACLLFADDVALLAPTRDSLQRLIGICARYCRNFCLKFNVGKTKIMIFGKLNSSYSSLAKIVVDNQPIEYVSSCRYLGFYLIASKCFKFSIAEDIRGFFGSVNSILTSVHKPTENVLMQLLFTNCVPKLTYGAAIKNLTAAEMQQYNVALNNSIRRIFGFRFWQSIRQIRECYGFDSIEVLFAKARIRFYSSLSSHSNGILRFLSTLDLDGS